MVLSAQSDADEHRYPLLCPWATFPSLHPSLDPGLGEELAGTSQKEGLVPPAAPCEDTGQGELLGSQILLEGVRASLPAPRKAETKGG